QGVLPRGMGARAEVRSAGPLARERQLDQRRGRQRPGARVTDASCAVREAILSTRVQQSRHGRVLAGLFRLRLCAAIDCTALRAERIHHSETDVGFFLWHPLPYRPME